MKQQTSKAKNSKWMTAGFCASISLIAHVVIAILLSLRLMMVKVETKEKSQEIPGNKEIVIQIKQAPKILKSPVNQSNLSHSEPPKIITPRAPLTPQELKDLAEKRVSVNEPKRVIEYTRTTPDQMTGKVPNTNIQGEHDTVAASNAQAVSEAPDRPSVKGLEPEDRKQELVDTNFQDGVLEHMNKESERKAEAAKKASVQAADKAAKISSSVEATKERGEYLDKGKLATTDQEHKKLKETLNKVAINETSPTSKNVGEKEDKGLENLKKTVANRLTDPDAMKRKIEEEKQKRDQLLRKLVEAKKAERAKKAEAAKLAKAAEGAKKAAKGFRSQAKAIAMQGTISRQSRIASKNVRATPLGRYMAKISKLVEKEWQRRVMMHADLIQPGMLRVSFMVDSSGKVSNYRLIFQSYGSTNQNALTHQAIRSIKIPSMPKKVKQAQKGEPLDLTYSFNFK